MVECCHGPLLGEGPQLGPLPSREDEGSYLGVWGDIRRTVYFQIGKDVRLQSGNCRADVFTRRHIPNLRRAIRERRYYVLPVWRELKPWRLVSSFLKVTTPQDRTHVPFRSAVMPKPSYVVVANGGERLRVLSKNSAASVRPQLQPN